ncbi:cytochrome p450 [Phlyctema vagabunda]|uniref:Cytochrome p450 n=1 Tax=Phlyctema vagabunda TaxID=108571 RepID=A0ABR4PT08_9HELO
MDPTSPLMQDMVVRAHETFTLAVCLWNTTLDPKLLYHRYTALKTYEAYPRVHSPHWDRILRTAVGLWDLSASKVSEVVAGLLPPMFVYVPFLFLSVPIVAYVVYQLYFHPLATYPGPLWAKLSGTRKAYHAWRGDLHYDMWECHQKYGPYVRYSPTYLIFNTTQACKDIYGHNKNMQKSASYLAMVHNTPSTFTLRNKKEHAWKKRILSQKFSDSAIRSYEPEMLKLVDRLCDALCPKSSERRESATPDAESPWSEPFNMSAWCDNLFFDLMTTTIFGENFDLLRSRWYRHIPEALSRSNKRVSVIVQWPLIIWRRLDKILFKDSVHGRKEFLRFVHNLVTDRMTRGPRKDVFSGLLNASDPTTGNKLSRDEIVAESILMIVAGSDTSSTLLASMFFYMAKNPTKKARLVKEVRTCFATKEEVRLGAKLSSCRYLQACISECLRMAPPVASAPIREVMVGGATVDGHHLPEGTDIGTGIYSIQHNEEYFPRPFDFLPERWLEEENPFGVNVSDALVPFSVGPRACLGKALAIAEGSFATAYVCWTLDLDLVESMKDIGGGRKNGRHGRHRPDEYQLYDHITSARNGPWIRFRRRDS